MSRSDIEEKVAEIIKSNLGPRDTKLSSFLLKDLGADSLDITEISMAIEDEFEVEA